jgi:hypothetical protein
MNFILLLLPRPRATLASPIPIRSTSMRKSMNMSRNRIETKLASCFGLRKVLTLTRVKLGWWNGRHVRLRGVCRKACGFKSRPEHQIAGQGVCSLTNCPIWSFSLTASSRLFEKSSAIAARNALPPRFQRPTRNHQIACSRFPRSGI